MAGTIHGTDSILAVRQPIFISNISQLQQTGWYFILNRQTQKDQFPVSFLALFCPKRGQKESPMAPPSNARFLSDADKQGDNVDKGADDSNAEHREQTLSKERVGAIIMTGNA